MGAIQDCAGAHAPHFAARGIGLKVVTTHGCDFASGPQMFSRRNVECEVYHSNLFIKDWKFVGEHRASILCLVTRDIPQAIRSR